MSEKSALRPAEQDGSGDQSSRQDGGKKHSVQITEPPMADRYGYTIVKVEEKHGPLHRAIPCMPLGLAIIFCILNIIAPGVGTLFSSFTVFCCGTTRIEKPLHAFGLNLLSAILQMVTFLVIVGWIWSILWGMTFVQLAQDKRKGVVEDTTPTDDDALVVQGIIADAEKGRK